MTISKLPNLNRWFKMQIVIKKYSTALSAFRFQMLDNNNTYTCIRVFGGGHTSMEMKLLTYSNLLGWINYVNELHS